MNCCEPGKGLSLIFENCHMKTSCIKLLDIPEHRGATVSERSRDDAAQHE